MRGARFAAGAALALLAVELCAREVARRSLLETLGGISADLGTLVLIAVVAGAAGIAAAGRGSRSRVALLFAALFTVGVAAQIHLGARLQSDGFYYFAYLRSLVFDRDVEFSNDYRLLGLVVWVGLGLTAILFFALVTWLSASRGLTLTLSGVTGLIVSVGVTVDSYVVYFERLKDEVRMGKTIRSSLDSGFRKAFRTIIAADLVSLLAAAALYLLAEGSVRGFALFLGLSTLIDLLIAYFVMHPLVSLMARRPALVRMQKVGIASGLDVAGVRA